MTVYLCRVSFNILGGGGGGELMAVPDLLWCSKL